MTEQPIILVGIIHRSIIIVKKSVVTVLSEPDEDVETVGSTVTGKALSSAFIHSLSAVTVRV